MGVDYTAKFGIGYKIKVAKEVVEDKYDGDTHEYLHDIIDNFVDGVTYFETGSEVYGGDENEWHLVVEEPFADGLDLTHIKACLDDIIESSDLERDSDFGVVGGLLIY
jgi:hypothetical protein